MFVRMGDRISRWLEVGSRRPRLMALGVSGLVLAPLWMTLIAFFLLRWGVLGEKDVGLFYAPIVVGAAGCLLLPIKPPFLKVLFVVAYVPVSFVLLLGFHLTVGCLITGRCL